jgi:hypothetical protein
MGKTKHSKISLRVPTDCVAGKPRKDYQDNEKPKNKPGKMFFKHGVDGVIREDQSDGHKSGGRTKRLYSRILRKKLDQETMEIIDDQDIDNNE